MANKFERISDSLGAIAELEQERQSITNPEYRIVLSRTIDKICALIVKYLES